MPPETVSFTTPSTASSLKGKFPEIASTIFHDLAELGNTMPVDMRDEEQFMRAVLLDLRYHMKTTK